MKTRMVLLTTVAALMADCASAASRSSANYSVPGDSVDAGGRKTTSANYANDGCVGGIGGISSVAVPAETAKHGYVGQLYEVSTLALAADPSPMTEGNTSQLAAEAVMDDATRLQLSGSRVAWSVVDGPIASINASGLATVETVYQDTAATVRGDYLGTSSTLGLLVLNVGDDDFRTYAGDGVADWWQVEYFGLDNSNAGPDADPDGDGQHNLFEYVAGTIPVDGASCFRLRVENVDGQPTHKHIIFSPRYPSRTYTVHSRLEVETGTFDPLPHTATSDNELERTVTDLDATDPTRFYRVRITLP